VGDDLTSIQEDSLIVMYVYDTETKEVFVVLIVTNKRPWYKRIWINDRTLTLILKK